MQRDNWITNLFDQPEILRSSKTILSNLLADHQTSTNFVTLYFSFLMSSILESISTELCEAFVAAKNGQIPDFISKIQNVRKKIHNFSEFYLKFQRLNQLKDLYLVQANKLEATKNIYIQLLSQLDNFTSEIQALNQHYDGIRKGLENPSECDLFDFLTIAKNCSVTRCAPENYAPQIPIEPFLPPVPTEDMMRRSILYNQKPFIGVSNGKQSINTESINTTSTKDNQSLQSAAYQDNSTVDIFPELDLNP